MCILLCFFVDLLDFEIFILETDQYLKLNIGRYYQASLIIVKLEFVYRLIFKKVKYWSVFNLYI